MPICGPEGDPGAAEKVLENFRAVRRQRDAVAQRRAGRAVPGAHPAAVFNEGGVADEAVLVLDDPLLSGFRYMRDRPPPPI